MTLHPPPPPTLWEIVVTIVGTLIVVCGCVVLGAMLGAAL